MKKIKKIQRQKVFKNKYRQIIKNKKITFTSSILFSKAKNKAIIKYSIYKEVNYFSDNKNRSDIYNSNKINQLEMKQQIIKHILKKIQIIHL